MQTIHIRQSLRPIRYAFLIRPKDEDSLLTAISVNTVLWGGLYNPIVVNAPDDECESVLDEFDPDYIVDFTENEVPARVRHQFDRRLIAREDVFRLRAATDDTVRGRHVKLGCGIGDVISWIRDTELRGLTESRVALPTLSGSLTIDYSRYAATVFGTFSYLPDADPLQLAKHYREALYAQDVGFDPSHDIDYRESIFPIQLTAYGLRTWGSFSLGRSSHVIYVGDPAEVSDLTEFWNLRASGRDCWFVPFNDYLAHAGMIGRVVSAARYRINSEIMNRPDVQRGRSVDLATFDTFTKWLSSCVGAETPYIIVRNDVLFQSPFDHVKACQIEAASGDEVSLFDGSRMTPIKLIDPPLYQTEDGRDSAWIVELSTMHSSDTNEWVFQLPRVPGCEEIIRDLIGDWGKVGSVRVGRRGLATTVNELRKRVYPSAVPTSEVFRVLFTHATGLEPSPSQPGRYATQIVNKMGGLRFGCRVFKLRGVREIIGKLGNGSTLTRGNMRDIVISERPDTFGTNWRADLYEYPFPQPNRRAFEFSEVFDELLAKRVIRPGMLFTCANCNSTEWYHVSEFGEDYACRLCFERQRVPFASSREWHFKADGVFRVQNSVEGSLAALLALARLDELHHGRGGIFATGTELRQRGKCIAELDFAYIAFDLIDTSYEIVLGEAKSFMDFDAKKLASLTSLADKFTPLPYIALATLKDQFSEQERDLVRRLSQAGYRFIPLTRLDLDPYNSFNRRDGAPHKYPVRLSDLHENTMHINIGS